MCVRCVCTHVYGWVACAMSHRLLLKELQGLTSPTSLTAAGALNDHQVGSVLQRVEWVINYLQSMLKLAQRAALAKDNKIGTGTQLPFWLDTESLLYETNIAALLNDDSKRLQAVLKGHECWNSTTDDVFLSVLSGKVPAAWEKRFPQLHAHAHSILSWIDALSDLTKELEMHLARAATPRDPVKVYTSSERPIRLGLLFHPNAFLKCIMTTAAETSSKTLRDLYWAIEVCDLHWAIEVCSTAVVSLSDFIPGCCVQGQTIMCTGLMDVQNVGSPYLVVFLDLSVWCSILQLLPK